MKKLLVTMLAVLSCGASYALPLMNPSEASLLCDGVFWEGHCGDLCDPCLTWCDAFSVRFGFYGDYIFNRYLEVNATKAGVNQSEIYTNAAYLAANFWDRVDIWGTLGETSLVLGGDGSIFAPIAGGQQRFTLVTENDFSYSIGVRGTIWECGCTSVGAEFQWFQARPDIAYLTSNGQNTVSPRDQVLDYTDWQIGVGVSHRINLLVPYIGVKWGTAQMKLGNANIDLNGTNYLLQNLKSVKTWGYAVGTSLVDCEKMSLTVEADFGNEMAVFANGQFRF